MPRPFRTRHAAAFAAIAASLTLAVPSPAALTLEQKQADLDQAAALLRGHPGLRLEMTDAQWAELVAAERARLSAADDAAFYLGLQRLAGAAHDGHTFALSSPESDWRTRALPAQFIALHDGVFVLAADPALADAVGQRVTALYGRPIDEVFRTASAHSPADNFLAARGRACTYLRFPSLMRAMDVGSGQGPVELRFEGPDGAERTLLVEPIAVDSQAAFRPGESWATPPRPAAQPLRAQRPDERHWFTAIEGGAVVYARYREVQNEEDGQTVAQFADELFAYIDSHPEVRRLVLDVRNNGGGNNYRNQPLLHGAIRSRLRRPGDVVCLIDASVFSAAMNLCADLERQTQTIFIGEPTAAGPNHCGDAQAHELPHSGITLRVSTVPWYGADPRDPRRWIRPDVDAPLTSRDFLEGSDPALDAAIAYVHPADAPFFVPNERARRASQLRPWLGVRLGIDDEARVAEILRRLGIHE